MSVGGDSKPAPQESSFPEERDPKFSSGFSDRDCRADDRGFRGPPKREWGDREANRYPTDRPPYRDSRVDNRDYQKRRRWRDDGPESPSYYGKDFKDKPRYGGSSRFSNFSGSGSSGYRDNRGSAGPRDSGGPPPYRRDGPRMYNRDPYDSYRDPYRDSGGSYDRAIDYESRYSREYRDSYTPAPPGSSSAASGANQSAPGAPLPASSSSLGESRGGPVSESSSKYYGDDSRSRDSYGSDYDRYRTDDYDRGNSDYDERREPGERTPEGRPSSSSTQAASSSASRYREPGEREPSRDRDARGDRRSDYYYRDSRDYGRDYYGNEKESSQPPESSQPAAKPSQQHPQPQKEGSSIQMYSPNSPSRDSPQKKSPDSPPPAANVKRPRLGWGQGLMGVAPKKEEEPPAAASVTTSSSAAETTESATSVPSAEASSAPPAPPSAVTPVDPPLTPSAPLAASNALARSLVSSTGSASGAPPAVAASASASSRPNEHSSSYHYAASSSQHSYPREHFGTSGYYGSSSAVMASNAPSVNFSNSSSSSYGAPHHQSSYHSHRDYQPLPHLPPRHHTGFDVLPSQMHAATLASSHDRPHHHLSITADFHRRQHHDSMTPPPVPVPLAPSSAALPNSTVPPPFPPSAASSLATPPSTAELPQTVLFPESTSMLTSEQKEPEKPKEDTASTSVPPAPARPEPPKKELPKREDVLTNIEKLDAEIAQLEHEIANLKNALNRPKHAAHALHRHLHGSIIQQIYDDNKEKAAAAAETMASLVLPPKLPSQSAQAATAAGTQTEGETTVPSSAATPVPAPPTTPAMPALPTPLPKNLLELPICQQNVRRHQEVRVRLQKVVQQQRAETKSKDLKLSSRYRKKFESWRRNLLAEKRRKLAQLRAADPAAYNRLRKEQLMRSGTSPLGVGSPARTLPLRGSTGRGGTPSATDRANRRQISDAVRSEEEFAAVCAALADEESQDPNRRYLRTIAVVPPMLIHPRDQQVRFYSTNGYIEDMREMELRRKNDNPWSEQEKAIFLDKYLQYPKRFRKISEFLPNKSTQDVVAYYFLNKRKLNLKKLVRDTSRGRRGSGPTPARPKMAPGVPRELANLGITSDFWQATPMSFMLYGRDRGTRGNRVRTSTSTPISPSPSATLDVDEFGNSSSHAAAGTGAESSSDSGDDLPLNNQSAAVAPPSERPPPKPRGRPPLNRSAAATAQPAAPSASPQSSPLRSRGNAAASSSASLVTAGNQSDDEQPTRWTDAERDLFCEALAKHAKDWKAVAEYVGTKNQFQCKNFYHNSRKRLNLDEIIEGGYRPKPAGTNRPATPAAAATARESVPQPSTANVPRASSGGVDSDGEGQSRRVVSYWTQSEKDDFLKYFQMYGRNWKALAQHITTKSQNQIKNFFQNYKVKLNLNAVLEQREKAGSVAPVTGNKRGPKPKKPLSTSTTAAPGSAAAGTAPAEKEKAPTRRGRPPKRKPTDDEDPAANDSDSSAALSSESEASAASSAQSDSGEVEIDDPSARSVPADETSNISAPAPLSLAASMQAEDSLQSPPPSPLLHSDIIKPFHHFSGPPNDLFAPASTSATAAASATATAPTTTATTVVESAEAPATGESSAVPVPSSEDTAVTHNSTSEPASTREEARERTEHSQAEPAQVSAPVADVASPGTNEIVRTTATATEPTSDAEHEQHEQDAEASSPVAPIADDVMLVSAAEPTAADAMQTESTPAPASPNAAVGDGGDASAVAYEEPPAASASEDQQ